MGNVTAHGFVEYLAIEDGISLVRTGMTSKRDGASWDLYLINQHDGERVTRWEQFDISDRDHALARFGELVERPDEATTAVPGNRAWDIGEQFRDAFECGDVGRQRGLLHPHFASHLRTSLLGVAETLDIDGHLDQIAAIAATGGSVRIALLATRGDDLTLARVITGPADAVSERLLVLRIENGLVIELVWFDETQLSQAMDEFDQLWVEFGSGSPELAALAPASRSAFASQGIDLDHLPFADDFVTVDHRPGGLGERRLDAFVESAQFITPSDMIITRYLAWNDSSALYEVVFDRHDDDFVWHALHTMEHRHGAVSRVDVFDPEQLDEARRRFGELTGTTAHGQSPTSADNPASRLAQQWTSP